MKTMERSILDFGANTSAPALVYKTRANYDHRVPVLMNDEKTSILSYPDPTDLIYGGVPALPTKLKNGYLLDNRGIGVNVAFLTYTYESYGALPKAPELNQLIDSLLDRNPLTELWDCGPRTLYKKEVDELNAQIEKGFPNGKALIEVMHVTR
ncbi:MAG TPA: hypothetical protein VFP20_09950 [Bacteroidales bacterium]|nr:hypothetical protein [Bacteroidales bacterium]